MVLHFHELHSLFLVLIEFIKVFGLNLFESVELAGGDVDCLINLGVLLAGSQHLEPFEI